MVVFLLVPAAPDHPQLVQSHQPLLSCWSHVVRPFLHLPCIISAPRLPLRQPSVHLCQFSSMQQKAASIRQLDERCQPTFSLLAFGLSHAIFGYKEPKGRKKGGWIFLKRGEAIGKERKKGKKQKRLAIFVSKERRKRVGVLWGKLERGSTRGVWTRGSFSFHVSFLCFFLNSSSFHGNLLDFVNMILIFVNEVFF